MISKPIGFGLREHLIDVGNAFCRSARDDGADRRQQIVADQIDHLLDALAMVLGLRYRILSIRLDGELEHSLFQ